MFTKLSALCIILATSVSGLMISPAGELGSAASGATGVLSTGAGGSAAAGGLSGAASGQASVSQLQALIAQVQGAAGSQSGVSAAPASTSASSKAEADLRAKFEKAQILHMRAANPMETADELGVESALRQAISSTPSRVGRSGGAGSSRASLA
jgi:hypothetical protein